MPSPPHPGARAVPEREATAGPPEMPPERWQALGEILADFCRRGVVACVVWEGADATVYPLPPGSGQGVRVSRWVREADAAGRPLRAGERAA